MNKVILMGRLTKDVELRHTQSGKAVASFTLACDRPKTKDGKSEADFISCVAWDKVGEVVAKYKAKGDQLLVEGRMQTRSYEQDGSKRYVTEVIVSNMEFVGSAGQRKAEPTRDEDPEEIPF